MGAGDVKFISLIALFTGLKMDFIYIVSIASVFSMLHSFLYFQFKKEVFLLNRYIISTASFSEKFKTIPYAGYVAVATILWMLISS